MSADTETLILEELRQVRKDLAELKSQKRAAVSPWIAEDEACQMLGRKDPEHFRQWVKSGKPGIIYRCTNNRNYQYSRKSIDRYLHESSNEL